MGETRCASALNLVLLATLVFLLPGCLNSFRRGPLELKPFARVLGEDLPPPAGTYARRFPGPCLSELHVDWDGAVDEGRLYKYNEDGTLFKEERKRFGLDRLLRTEWWLHQYDKQGKKTQWSYGCINTGSWSCGRLKSVRISYSFLTGRIEREDSTVQTSKGIAQWSDEYVYGSDGVLQRIDLLRPNSDGELVRRGARSFSYDKNGRVVREEHDEPLGGPVEWTYNYAYDEQGQVVQESLVVRGTLDLYRLVRTYDEHGNLVLEENYDSGDILREVRLFSYECWQ